ncbi:MAG: PEP-CTERM sorting domain-containing protein [Bacteroidia bacterium]
MKKYTLAEVNSLAENPLQANTQTALFDQEGKEIEIPESGSLGLLALGYTGLMLWRNKKRANTQQSSTLDTYYSSLTPSQDESK